MMAQCGCAAVVRVSANCNIAPRSGHMRAIQAYMNSLQMAVSGGIGPGRRAWVKAVKHAVTRGRMVRNWQRRKQTRA